MSKIILALSLLLIISCKPESTSFEKLVVTVSILPQKYFVERIAGDLLEVNVLIPPGANPSTYEPTVSQLSKLVQSPLYLRIGYVGFELSWMEKINAVNPTMKVVDLSEGIELIHEDEQNMEADRSHLHGNAHGGIDPHVWMSTINSKIIAKNTYTVLIQQFPEEAEILEARFTELILELDSVHSSISKMLSGQENRSFMIYHPALSYLARDFYLEQYPLEIGGKTPTPAHMKWMIDLGKQKRIKTIFLQEQFDQRNAEVLADEIDAKIVLINPMDPDWQGQMQKIANQLSLAL